MLSRSYLKNIEYDFIGNLDADVSFCPDYYKNIIQRFEDNPKLGIAGGIVYDFHKGIMFKRRYYSISTSGAIQFFRRQCYEDIGGYIPQYTGGVDTIAEVTARMKEWETRTFPDIEVLHHRRVGTEGCNVITAKFREGCRDCMHGSHPLFYFVRCLYGVSEPPYFIGGLMRYFGFLFASINKNKIESEVTNEFVSYLRSEQIKKLK